MEGKLTKKPYKPYITSPRHRGGRSEFRPRVGRSSSDRGEGWTRSKGRFRGRRGDSPIEEDSREGNLTKAPLPRDPVYPAKLKTKDKDRCYHCHQRGHFSTNCPERNKTQPQKSSEGKKFEDYTYAYGGAEDPQLAMDTAFLPQTYEEALSTMRQSLKNQDPLHGLNM